MGLGIVGILGITGLAIYFNNGESFQGKLIQGQRVTSTVSNGVLDTNIGRENLQLPGKTTALANMGLTCTATPTGDVTVGNNVTWEVKSSQGGDVSFYNYSWSGIGKSATTSVVTVKYDTAQELKDAKVTISSSSGKKDILGHIIYDDILFLECPDVSVKTTSAAKQDVETEDELLTADNFTCTASPKGDQNTGTTIQWKINTILRGYMIPKYEYRWRGVESATSTSSWGSTLELSKKYTNAIDLSNVTAEIREQVEPNSIKRVTTISIPCENVKIVAPDSDNVDQKTEPGSDEKNDDKQDTNNDEKNNDTPDKTPTCTTFKDVKNSDDDYKAIMWVKSTGIMTGSDCKFRPDDTLKRAEILAVVLRAFDLHSATKNYCNNNDIFPDNEPKGWFYQIVCNAYKRGIVKGYTEGKLKGQFGANLSVVRAEMYAMLLRNLDETMPSVTKYPWPDVQFSDWFSPYAAYAKREKLHDSKNFHGADFVERREVARVLYLLHENGDL